MFNSFLREFGFSCLQQQRNSTVPGETRQDDYYVLEQNPKHTMPFHMKSSVKDKSCFDRFSRKELVVRRTLLNKDVEHLFLGNNYSHIGNFLRKSPWSM